MKDDWIWLFREYLAAKLIVHKVFDYQIENISY